MATLMNHDRMTFRGLDEDSTVRAILEGTATETGERFFDALVENLAKALGTYSAWVTEYIEASRELRSLAFWVEGRLIENFHIDIKGTPCETVIESAGLVHYPDHMIDLFPNNSTIKEFSAVSYMGVPLIDANGKILGNLAVLDNRPMPEEPSSQLLFRIFAARATAELQRIHAETEIRKREEKYRRIVETAGEGFLLMDKRWTITDVNDAFCQLVGARRDDIIGKTPLDFASEDHRQFLITNKKEIYSGQYQEFEGTIVSRTGRNIPILVHGNTLRDDLGDIIGYMAFVTNMTEHKKSLALAGEIQNSLLPQSSLRVYGLDIAGRTLACDEIGGDYFDFLWGQECSNNHFEVAVGDVTGHGVDAALLMMTARTFLRMRTLQCGDIARIVTDMNLHLIRDFFNTSHFMTLFYMRIDPETGNLHWIRAGHDPAFIYDPTEDRFEELRGSGLPLGVDESVEYEENRKTGLSPGQVIVIGTDGIWETSNGDGRMFGKPRFREIIRDHAHLPANAIIDAVYDDVKNFMRGLKQTDDMTLVVIKLDDLPCTGERQRNRM